MSTPVSESKPEQSVEPAQLPLERRIRPTRAEWLTVLCLIVLLLGFNIVTCDYYPTVWCDEVLFSEPAINMVKHGCFTTTVWEYNPANTFPVVNCPLYPMALVPWLAVTGTTLLAVRSLNYTLMAVSAFLVWLVSWRFGLVKTAWARLTMVALLHLGYGMSFSYRCSRPDILGMLCLLLLLFAFAIRAPRPRAILLFLLAAVSVWIGLQVALFAAFASFLAWRLLRQGTFKDLIVLALGMAAGAGSLVLFLAWHRVLPYFFTSIIGLIGKSYAHTQAARAGSALVRTLLGTPRNYLGDPTTLVLVAGLLVLLVAGWGRLSAATRRLALYSLLLFLAIPFLFNVVGHDAFYYSYLRFVPVTLALFAAYSELATASARVRPVLKLAFVTSVCIGALVGLPSRLGLMLAIVKGPPRSEVRRIVSSNIVPTDVVFSDYAPFFEVKEVAGTVYDPYFSSELIRRNVLGFDFTAEQKHAISVLVIRPEQEERMTRFFGGRWKAVSEPFGDFADFHLVTRLPFIGRKLANYANQPQNERYQVQIFRRHPDVPAAAPMAGSPP
jgi:hypothetical protein